MRYSNLGFPTNRHAPTFFEHESCWIVTGRKKAVARVYPRDMLQLSAGRNIMTTMSELINATISSNPISDESILGCAYGIEYYDLRVGQDGCTQANVGQYRSAMQSLYARLVELRATMKAKEAASRPAHTEMDLEIMEQITALEAQAQEFVDRDQLGKAQKLGQQIRVLRAQLRGAR